MTSFLQEMSQHDFLLNSYKAPVVPKIQRQRQQGTFADMWGCVCIYIFTLKLHNTKVKSFTSYVSQN